MYAVLGASLLIRILELVPGTAAALTPVLRMSRVERGTDPAVSAVQYTQPAAFVVLIEIAMSFLLAVTWNRT